MIGTSHFEYQFVGNGTVPWNHLFVQPSISIDVEMSVVAFCFSGRVVVAFLVGDVAQIRMAFIIPEMAIN